MRKPTTADALCEIVRGALDTAPSLFLPEERERLSSFLALSHGSRDLVARLASRKRPVFRVDKLECSERQYIDLLAQTGWVVRVEDVKRRSSLMTVQELRTACSRHGLDHRGKRAALLMRLQSAERSPDPARWPEVWAIGHRSLFRRAERIWFQDPHRSRTEWILDAVGQRRFAKYELTEGSGVFRTREDLLRYEAAEARSAQNMPLVHLEWAMALLEEPGGAHLAARRIAQKIAGQSARALERSGQPDQAAGVYERLLSDEDYSPNRALWAHRYGLALDAAGRTREALRALAQWRDQVPLGAQIGLDRTGRRLARRSGLPWLPTRPLRTARERHIPLPGLHRGDEPIECAVQRWIEQGANRRVLRGEASPWTTLFALLLYELYWLPVEGMLPAPGLPGPLDLGSPMFATHREAALQEVLQAIRAGEGPARTAQADRAHRGEWLAGARWSRNQRSDLTQLAAAVGPQALALIIERLAREGWGARRGLPDLIVLPGAPSKLPEGFPVRVAPCLHLVEVKGPGDHLRDDQRAWLHLLTSVGVKFEIWWIRRGNSGVEGQHPEPLD